MLTLPDTIRHALEKTNQSHVIAAWERLDDAGRKALLEQLTAVDIAGLPRLFALRDEKFALPDPSKILPVPVIPANSPDDAAAKSLGEEALRRGEVAALVVAGGQGSRLGFEHPKGMYPVGPVSRKTLFQIHAEKVLAQSRRYGKAIPLLVMTSPATHAETEAFFKDHKYFGLPPAEVFFFQQGGMPTLDLNTGRLLFEKPGKLFVSPDGHGGTLTALAKSGLLEKMYKRGVHHIFYFQVDNPLVKIADPTFLGHHLKHKSEASSRVVAKRDASERMGVFASVNGRCTIIEYIDLPKDLMTATDANGRLRLWAGSPAIHFFETAFLDRITSGPSQMPFHVARRRSPTSTILETQSSRQRRTPSSSSASSSMRCPSPIAGSLWKPRAEEFAPLKNATGEDSAATVDQALRNLAASWLESAGVKVPRSADGSVTHPLEISPLFALDAQEVKNKVDRRTVLSGPRYFE